jgi:hypothetical protein
MLALYGLALSHEALHLCPHTHGHGHVVHGCAEHPESEHSREGSDDTHCGLCELIYSASLGIVAFPLVAAEVPTATYPQLYSVYRAHLMLRPPGRAPPA